jgi:hypothetical protein
MRPDSKNEAIPIPMVFAEFKIMHTLMELELDFSPLEVQLELH